MDYIHFCRNYFNITHIPVSLLKNSVPVYSSISEALSIPLEKKFPLFPPSRNPEICILSPDLEYGHIEIENTDLDLILGPIFNLSISDELIRQFMHEQMIPLQYKEALSDLLYSLPKISHIQLLENLSLLHLCLNDQCITPEDLFEEDEKNLLLRSQAELKHHCENLENEHFHTSYAYELQLCELVRNGIPEELKNFLFSSQSLWYSGKLSSSPLRHAKNAFISLISKVALIGAIPGGVNIEKTYQLIDEYVQECELLQSIDSINRLQYTMLLDFCQRAGEQKIPAGISSEVYLCMNYIRTHTNESIHIEDVAAQINRSSSYIMKRFKSELGIHINAYIMRCKLEEAKSLLVYSEKTLSEISNYLCFSNQSYFQNTFKKQYGITPLQYRKKHQKIY